MLTPTESAYRVPFDGTFHRASFSTRAPKDVPGKKALKEILRREVKELRKYQEMLYAQDQHSLLLVFQAMDAAGKDGTVRAILSGVNPAGCQVTSFKQPSKTELDHDYLWRTACALPERGRIGVFNRRLLRRGAGGARAPEVPRSPKLPHADPARAHRERYESIRDHERHLARNGTVILKFWLNVSYEEQRRRFLDGSTILRRTGSSQAAT
ncbi:MAG: hypothetical protein R3F17_16110 [Planctomycetota bacterium]